MSVKHKNVQRIHVRYKVEARGREIPAISGFWWSEGLVAQAAEEGSEGGKAHHPRC